MAEPMSTDRLAEIEASIPVDYAPTWTVEPEYHDDVLTGWLVGYDRSHVAPELRDLCGLVARVPDYGHTLAEFITIARTAVPELLAEVKRLREQVQFLGRQLQASALPHTGTAREIGALRAENADLHAGLTAAQAAIGRVEEVADWGVPVGPVTIRRALDGSQSLLADEQAAAEAAKAGA